MMAETPAVMLDYKPKGSPADGGAESQKEPGSLMLNAANILSLDY